MFEQNLSTHIINKTTSLAQGTDHEDHFNRSPLCRKIHALIDCDGFQWDSQWIANKLDTRVEDVESSLNVMEKIGVVSIVDGKVIDNYKNVPMKPTDKDVLMESHRLSTMEILTNVQEKQFELAHGYHATNWKALKEFGEGFRKLRNKFVEESKKGKKDLLVGYTFTGANLLKVTEGDNNV